MAADTAVPVALYIAVYGDDDAAQADWDALKALVTADLIKLDGLVLIKRGDDGKIDVKDNAHVTAGGAVLGAVGGLVIGLIFPPAFLASGLVGAAAGGGVGALVTHRERKQIKHEVEDVMPRDSSAIVALFEQSWIKDVEKSLAKADAVTTHEVAKDSADEVKAAAAKEG